ncbi:MAG: hypothetical protein JNM51_09840 [Bacteroidia bacterium]|nr:hypothetical protein [Bacteroidia bacterium]
MIKSNTIFYIGVIVLIIYLLTKVFVKQLEEIKIKRQINKKPVYQKAIPEEQVVQSEELERLISEERNSYYDKLFAGKDFINKDTTSLDQFIINAEMNHNDLYKLAQLNGIKVEMNKGWNNLALKLIVELDDKGWNRKVSSIKEKFGELRFYAETDHEDILNKYTEESKTICEICGRSGEFFTINTWDFTRCDEHRNS